MKMTIITAVILLLVGCSAFPPPQSDSISDWKEYGEQRGEQGLLRQSESRLEKQDQTGSFSSEQYAAYQEGYQAGRLVYCKQNPYLLGVMGKPYNGVCDDLNPFYYQDYMSGRNSRAGRL